MIYESQPFRWLVPSTKKKAQIVKIKMPRQFTTRLQHPNGLAFIVKKKGASESNATLNKVNDRKNSSILSMLFMNVKTYLRLFRPNIVRDCHLAIIGRLWH